MGKNPGKHNFLPRAVWSPIGFHNLGTYGVQKQK